MISDSCECVAGCLILTKIRFSPHLNVVFSSSLWSSAVSCFLQWGLRQAALTGSVPRAAYNTCQCRRCQCQCRCKLTRRINGKPLMRWHTEWSIKTGPFSKVLHSCMWWRRKKLPIYQSARQFIRGKTVLLNFNTVKYSLH